MLRGQEGCLTAKVSINVESCRGQYLAMALTALMD